MTMSTEAIRALVDSSPLLTATLESEDAYQEADNAYAGWTNIAYRAELHRIINLSDEEKLALFDYYITNVASAWLEQNEEAS